LSFFFSSLSGGFDFQSLALEFQSILTKGFGFHAQLLSLFPPASFYLFNLLPLLRFGLA
jgi:hypothetical protein